MSPETVCISLQTVHIYYHYAWVWLDACLALFRRDSEKSRCLNSPVRGEASGDAFDSETELKRSEIAPLLRSVLEHAVLKWLHNSLLEKVMLWQSAAASHDLWHASRLGDLPGEVFNFTSPALVAHAASLPTNIQAPFKSVEVHDVCKLGKRCCDNMWRYIP